VKRTDSRNCPVGEDVKYCVVYLIQYVLPDFSDDYLFILGGEAKTKAKGMQYSMGDDYSFTPYFVFATAEKKEEYGTPSEERQVSGRTFYEYPVTNEEVRKKVTEFISICQNKEFPDGI